MPPSTIIHWAFDPVALRIGPLSLHWYGMLWAAAFILGELIARRQLRAMGRAEVDVSSLTAFALLGTIVGARLAHCFFYDPGYYLAHPLKILAIWEGGLASHGGAVGLIAVLAWAKPRFAPGLPLLSMLDVVALPAAIGATLIRFANFLNSEIVGVPVASRAWGVVFESVDNMPRHPAQLYEAICYAVIAVFLWTLARRGDVWQRRGELTGWFLALVFGARAVVEIWKTPQAVYEGGQLVTVGQWLSLPFIALGVWMIWHARHRPAAAAAAAGS